jgi:hypothetical protein
MNQMACPQSTQRYVDILISVQQEVQDAGGETGDELKGPADKTCQVGFFFVSHWV